MHGYPPTTVKTEISSGLERHQVLPFFRAIAEEFKPKDKDVDNKHIVLICVDHVVSNLPYFLKALTTFGNFHLGAFIPKSSWVYHPEILDKIKEMFPEAFTYEKELPMTYPNHSDPIRRELESCNRSTFETKIDELTEIIEPGLGKKGSKNNLSNRSVDPMKVLEALYPEFTNKRKKERLCENLLKDNYVMRLIDYVVNQYIERVNREDEQIKPKDVKVLILDIGGRFAASLPLYYDHPNFLATIEDTENGHGDYQKVCANANAPINKVISVARKKLKTKEDWRVGESIVAAAHTILSIELGNALGDFNSVVVIGCGKIGSAMINALKKRGVKKITAIEKEPDRATHAKDQYKIDVVVGSTNDDRNRTVINTLRQAEIIFCATGNQSLTRKNFHNLANNVLVVSCTSPDKEFDFEYLIRASKEEVSPRGLINCFSYRGMNLINILARGSALNMIYNSGIGPHIFPVKASIFTAALKFKKSNAFVNGQFNSEYFQAIENSNLFEPTDKEDSIILKFYTQYFSTECRMARPLTWGIEPETDAGKRFLQQSAKQALIKAASSVISSKQTNPYEQLKTEIIIIKGPSGAGKSAVCRAMLLDQHMWHNHRYFFHADSLITLQLSYIKFANDLQLVTGFEPLDVIFSKVIDFLENSPGWICVYDGVNNYDDIRELIPRSGGLVVFSCNDEALLPPDKIKIIKVENFNKNRARYFIKSQLHSKKENTLTQAEIDSILTQGDSYNPLELSLRLSIITKCKEKGIAYDLSNIPNTNKLVQYIFEKLIFPNDRCLENMLASAVLLSFIDPNYIMKFSKISDFGSLDDFIDYGLVKNESDRIYIFYEIQKYINEFVLSKRANKADFLIKAIKNILNWFIEQIQLISEEKAKNFIAIQEDIIILEHNLQAFLLFIVQLTSKIDETSEKAIKEIFKFILQHDDFIKNNYRRLGYLGNIKTLLKTSFTKETSNSNKKISELTRLDLLIRLQLIEITYYGDDIADTADLIKDMNTELENLKSTHRITLLNKEDSSIKIINVQIKILQSIIERKKASFFQEKQLAYEKMRSICYAENNFDKAKIYFDKAKKCPDKIEKCFSEAEKYLSEAKKLSQELNDDPITQIKRISGLEKYFNSDHLSKQRREIDFNLAICKLKRGQYRDENVKNKNHLLETAIHDFREIMDQVPYKHSRDFNVCMFRYYEALYAYCNNQREYNATVDPKILSIERLESDKELLNDIRHVIAPRILMRIMFEHSKVIYDVIKADKNEDSSKKERLLDEAVKYLESAQSIAVFEDPKHHYSKQIAETMEAIKDLRREIAMKRNNHESNVPQNSMKHGENRSLIYFSRDNQKRKLPQDANDHECSKKQRREKEWREKKHDSTKNPYVMKFTSTRPKGRSPSDKNKQHNYKGYRK